MFECGLETGSCLAPSEQRIQNRAKCAAKMGAGDESFLQFASCSSEAKVGQEQSTLRLYYEWQLGGIYSHGGTNNMSIVDTQCQSGVKV